ncbi:MAG: folate family ECF transporter S component [Clostridiales bacterium]|nr:folate family ECF transporter S component [Clostridiales bacterium]
MITTRKLVTSALLIAMAVVLTRLLGINVLTAKIGFGFVPIIVAAMTFGPAYAAIIYAIADVIGALLFPAGAFNPFFTLNAFLAGAVWGLILYRKAPASHWGTIGIAFVAALVNNIVFSLVTNTLLIHFFYDVRLISLIPTRLIQIAIMIPLQTIFIAILWKNVIPYLSKWSSTRALT